MSSTEAVLSPTAWVKVAGGAFLRSRPYMTRFGNLTQHGVKMRIPLLKHALHTLHSSYKIWRDVI